MVRRWEHSLRLKIRQIHLRSFFALILEALKFIKSCLWQQKTEGAQMTDPFFTHLTNKKQFLPDACKHSCSIAFTSSLPLGLGPWLRVGKALDSNSLPAHLHLNPIMFLFPYFLILNRCLETVSVCSRGFLASNFWLMFLISASESALWIILWPLKYLPRNRCL